MKYIIVCGQSAYDLTERVESMIKKDWTPLGGVCVGINSAKSSVGIARDTDFYQAMTKEDPTVRVYDAKGKECK